MKNLFIFAVFLSLGFTLSTDAIASVGDGDTKGPGPTCSPTPAKKSTKRSTKPASDCPTCITSRLDKIEKSVAILTKDGGKVDKLNEQVDTLITQAKENGKKQDATNSKLDAILGWLNDLKGSIGNLPANIQNISDWMKWLFWGLILGFIILIGLGIYRAGQGTTTNRRLENIEADQTMEMKRAEEFRVSYLEAFRRGTNPQPSPRPTEKTTTTQTTTPASPAQPTKQTTTTRTITKKDDGDDVIEGDIV